MLTEWMDRFVALASAWSWLVLLATWRALPILVIVVGLGLALRRKLSPSLHALLLTLVLARLLLPVSVESPLSLHKPIDDWVGSNLVETAHPTNPTREHAYGLLPNVDVTDVQDGPTRTQAKPAIAADYSLDEILYLTISFILVFVSSGLLVRDVLANIQFAWKLRSCRLLDQPHLVDLLLRECDSLAVGRRPAVCEVPSLTAPAVFGVFRQTICLPPNLMEALSEEELRWVIRHELAHIRRRDIPVVFMASLVSSLHWFNPLVWLVVSRLRAAMEAAADRLALKHLSQSDVSAYGNLLLRLAENSVAVKQFPALGLISFASGKHLKQRVELLMQDQNPTNPWAKFVCGGLVAIIAVAGLTDAKEATEELPHLDFAAGGLMSLQVQPLWNSPVNSREGDGPTFVKEYDLESIFETMPRAFIGSELARQDQLAAWLPLPPALEGKWNLSGMTLSADLTAPHHALLRQTLEIWKHGEPRQISIEARFIRANIKTAGSIDWAGRRIDGLIVRGLGPAIAARVDESELAQLVRNVCGDRNGNIWFAPKVTVFDGQTASIADQVQRPFVTGIDPKSDGRMQPVVSIVDEGLRFVLTPKTAEDNSISLSFEVMASTVRKVSYANLPFKDSGNAASQFTVQVPATEQYAVSSSVKLTAGESIVVAIPRVFDNRLGADAETTIIVALTPRIIDTKESSGPWPSEVGP